MNKPSKISSAQRVRAYRARKRAQGLRPVTFWLPDLSDPTFIERARAEARAIAASPYAKDDMAFIDAVSIDHWADES